MDKCFCSIICDHFIKWPVWPYIIGYFYTIFLGGFFIKKIMKELKSEVRLFLSGNEDVAQTYGWYAYCVGYIEGILYVTVLLLGHAEFIAAWLAFKIVGRWESSKLERKEREKLMTGLPLAQKLILNNAEYNIFTIGNALSIIYAVTGWLIIICLKNGKLSEGVYLSIFVVLLFWVFSVSAQRQSARLKKLFPDEQRSGKD
jgi:hypothetical protein